MNYNIQEFMGKHPTIEKVTLTGLALLAALGIGGCKNQSPEPKKYESAYEHALEKLDHQTAQHWQDVELNLNSEQAINELSLIPEEARLVLKDDIKDYAANDISDEELSDLADPDRDGIKSSYEVENGTNPIDPSNSLEEISQKTFGYVRNLVEYNDSQKDSRDLPTIYSNLGNALYVVEKQPKIVNGLDIYGVDFLAHFLSDKDTQEALKYWRGVNALGLQGQLNFYDIPTSFNVKGLFKDKKYNPAEQKIVDEIWEKRVLWQKNNEVLIPMDDSIVDLWNDENVQINNLRQSLMPHSIFTMDIITGKSGNDPVSNVYGLYDPYDTDTWIKVAQHNLSYIQSKHDEFWPRTTDPNYVNIKYKASLLEELTLLGLFRRGTPNRTEVEAKYKEYLDVAFENGMLQDLALMRISGYAQIIKPGKHEIYIAAASLYAWSVGGAIYRAVGTIPPIGEDSDYAEDGNVGIPISDSLYEALQKEGNPIIEKTTNTWPQRFGVDKELLEKNEVKWVIVHITEGTKVLFGDYPRD